jgi:O-acetyl-ADP-ribose deacetylase (regulator of RNase III)
MLKKKWGDTLLSLQKGDIAKVKTQAVVNAANSALAGGAGVDGAIHRAAGPSLMEECREIGGCPTGQAVVTGAGNMRALKVIHTVGPVFSGSKKDAELLADCYRNSLDRARQNGLDTVAFPSISTGAYGYPLDQAARVALGAIRDYVKANPGVFKEIKMVLYDQKALDAYQSALTELRED